MLEEHVAQECKREPPRQSDAAEDALADAIWRHHLADDAAEADAHLRAGDAAPAAPLPRDPSSEILLPPLGCLYSSSPPWGNLYEIPVRCNTFFCGALLYASPTLPKIDTQIGSLLH